MITRRDMIKWGVVVPTLAAAPQALLAQSPEGLDALVIDRRHLVARPAEFHALKTYPIDGDVTALANMLNLAVEKHWASNQTAAEKLGFDPTIERTRIQSEQP